MIYSPTSPNGKSSNGVLFLIQTFQSLRGVFKTRSARSYGALPLHVSRCVSGVLCHSLKCPRHTVVANGGRTAILLLNRFATLPQTPNAFYFLFHVRSNKNTNNGGSWIKRGNVCAGDCEGRTYAICAAFGDCCWNVTFLFSVFGWLLCLVYAIPFFFCCFGFCPFLFARLLG